MQEVSILFCHIKRVFSGQLQVTHQPHANAQRRYIREKEDKPRLKVATTEEQ
jgi:hypothetical protein